MIEVVKGGLILDIGLRGFLPASLVDLRRVRDLAPVRRHRAGGEDHRARPQPQQRGAVAPRLPRGVPVRGPQEVPEGLQKNERRKGTVSSIVNFGAFVDLGGVDGLVHVSELSWKHVDHPSEVVAVGQEVEVEVLDVDLERERVSLSLKATQEDPWKEFERKYQAGEIIEGQVTKLVPFGAFVRVAQGIEGLVHISELSDQHVESPEPVLSVGDQVRVKVIDVDVSRRRISLSMRQVGGSRCSPGRPRSAAEPEPAEGGRRSPSRRPRRPWRRRPTSPTWSRRSRPPAEPEAAAEAAAPPAAAEAPQPLRHSRGRPPCAEPRGASAEAGRRRSQSPRRRPRPRRTSPSSRSSPTSSVARAAD